jgi:hypothetical protein
MASRRSENRFEELRPRYCHGKWYEADAKWQIPVFRAALSHYCLDRRIAFSLYPQTEIHEC